MALFDPIRRLLGLSIGEDGPRCTACDSPDVSELHPGVYDCPDCGYSGGPGQAALEEARQAQLIERLPPTERKRRAQRLVAEATRELLSCEGDFRRAIHASNVPLSGIEADDNDREYQRGLLNLYAAVDSVRRAHALDPTVPSLDIDQVKSADGAPMRSVFSTVGEFQHVPSLFSSADAARTHGWVRRARERLETYIESQP